MITRKQSIQQFSARMDELINCNYILADKKITMLLKTVTASKLFYQLICYCAEGFDYGTAKTQALIGQPFQTTNKKLLIAFGFSLLTAIDCKEEDLLTILSTYYPADNFDRSYKNFAEQFLTPFKLCIEEIALTMVAVSDKEKPQPVLTVEQKPATEEEIIFKFEEQKKYASCFKDIQKVVWTEKSKILESRFVKEGEKKDLLTLLEQFKDSLFTGNKEEIRTSFISYAATAFKKLNSDVDDIERMLKFCGII